MKYFPVAGASLIASLLLGTAGAALAAPATYNIDPDHTFPSFAADHMGGLSVWRGKFNKTSGTVTYDKQTGAGTVDIQIDVKSIDFGQDQLNEHMQAEEALNTAKYPTATYKGKLAGFKNGAPTEVDGTLELHGVSKPLKLKINSFKCMPHPMYKKEVCGADASGVFNRADFGVSYGQAYGFNMQVRMDIQIEALKAD